VAPEEPESELGEGGLAVEPAGLRHPLVEQHELLLGALARPQAQPAGLREETQKVRAALPRDVDAGRGHGREQLLASGAAPTGQGLDDHLPGPSRDRVGELQLRPPGGPPGQQPDVEQLGHPAQVLGRGQVEGAAHGPRTDHGPLVE
jgi:hypothetical protein